LTAHALQGDRERCLAADYVAKPLHPENLIETITSNISKIL
jgi:CheY-like chemotaxis protein